MKISFSKKKLKRLCENDLKMQCEYGQDVTKRLKIRLADLESAGNVYELPRGSPHPLKGKRKGEYSVSITNMLRLVFKPVNEPIPMDDTGNIQWELVTDICILSIEDYHG